MKVSVLFFAQLRELSGVREAEFSLVEGSRLSDLVNQVHQQYGSAFKKEMDNIAGLRILVNGREYELLGGMDAPLQEGDNVALLPPIGGG